MTPLTTEARYRFLERLGILVGSGTAHSAAVEQALTEAVRWQDAGDPSKRTHIVDSNGVVTEP